jgi:hypothetical protein
MRTHPDRIKHAAIALADAEGPPWTERKPPERAKLLTIAEAVITALVEYDRTRRIGLLREGRLKSIQEGRPDPSRKPLKEDAKVQLARRMLRQQSTTRQVRAATGLGNSTISRIAAEIEGRDVRPGRRPATAAPPP